MAIERTVKSIVDTAMNLLGYTGQNGNEQLSRRILNKAIPIFNVVYADIWKIEAEKSNTDLSTFSPVKSLSDTVSLETRAIEALEYGAAAYLAQSESDADNQSLWMSNFNQKRAGLSGIGRVRNTIPFPR